MSGEFAISSVLSRRNINLKQRMDQRCSLLMGQCYSFMLQLFYLERKRKYIQKTWKERPPAQFWLLCLYVFSPPPGPALCKLGQPGVLFVFPEVLTLVLRPSFVLFRRLFPSLYFSHHHSDSFFLFYLSNIYMGQKYKGRF